ncbi:MAG: STAS domain-containing protein [Actinobacteria bacterium]|nr:MAG: STAS domain-containing protein [Actinomycetota bacterium]
MQGEPLDHRPRPALAVDRPWPVGRRSVGSDRDQQRAVARRDLELESVGVGRRCEQENPRLVDRDPHLIDRVERQLQQGRRACGNDPQDVECIRSSRDVHRDRCREVLHELVIEGRTIGTWSVLTVSGELDLATAPGLRERVREMTPDGPLKVALELTGVGFVDSSGLGAIVACLKHVRELEGDLVLVAPDASPVAKLLSLTGLEPSITRVQSVDDLR